MIYAFLAVHLLMFSIWCITMQRQRRKQDALNEQIALCRQLIKQTQEERETRYQEILNSLGRK